MTPYITPQFVNHLDREIKTIVQLGACDAGDTGQIIDLYHPDTLVYFEGHPALFQACSEFLRLHSNDVKLLEFIPKLAFSYVGEIPFWTVPLDDPHGAFEHSSVYRHPRIPSMIPITLPCTTLDEETKRLGITHIDLLCSDIEGSESKAFTGQEILRKTKYIICEAGFQRDWKPGYPILEDVEKVLFPYGFEKIDWYGSESGGEVMFANKQL